MEFVATIPSQVEIIKGRAAETIRLRYPDWKQRNMTARAVELLFIKSQREHTKEEQLECDEIIAAWEWIKQVRADSNREEAELGILNT